VQRLRELGWIEGRTIAIEYRWADGRTERFAEIAAEFVRLKVSHLFLRIRPHQLWLRSRRHHPSRSSSRRRETQLATNSSSVLPVPAAT
jgi:hypothetical protein